MTTAASDSAKHDIARRAAEAARAAEDAAAKAALVRDFPSLQPSPAPPPPQREPLPPWHAVGAPCSAFIEYYLQGLSSLCKPTASSTWEYRADILMMSKFKIVTPETSPLLSPSEAMRMSGSAQLG